MPYTDLKPIPDNIYQTFVDNSIGRNRQVISFAAYLCSTESNTSIAIDDSWGSGKTFFVKQVQMVLEALSGFRSGDYDDDKLKGVLNKIPDFAGDGTEFSSLLPVYYDAWAYDNESDPILSLILEIINATGQKYKKSYSETLKELAKLGASVLESFTKLDLSNVPDVASKLRGEDPFSELRTQREMQEEMNSFLTEVCKERGNKLIIFVDELDRCKPTFAIKLLERVKHYFTNENVIFVFSVNGKELQHTVKRFYGEQFGATRYLDRFFDVTVSLLPVNSRTFERYIGEVSGSRVFHDVCDYVIEQYGLTMREQIRFYRRLNHVSPYADKQNYASQYSLILAMPLAVGVQINNRDQYSEFIAGRFPDPFVEMMERNECFGVESYMGIGNKPTKDEMKTVAYQIYDALFAHNYSMEFHIEIGRLHFDEDTRKSFFSVLATIPDTLK